LNPAQLAQKRANDREAQRAMRQRNKAYTASLELRLKQLSDVLAARNDGEYLEKLRKENRELELNKSRLQELLEKSSHAFEKILVSPVSISSQDPHKTPRPNFDTTMLLQTEPLHLGESLSFTGPPVATLTHQTPWRLESPEIQHVRVNDLSIHKVSAENQDSCSSQTYSYVSEFSMPSGPHSYKQYDSCKEVIQLPIHKSKTSMPSSFICQPSTVFWELPILVIPPTGDVDKYIMELVQSHRHNNITTVSPSSDARILVGGGNARIPIDPVSTAISHIVHGYKFLTQTIEVKAATVCMLYNHIRWLVAPRMDTYNNLPFWYQPRASQMAHAHPLYVSLLLWPRLRDSVIHNQQLYPTETFLAIHVDALVFNWSHGPQNMVYLDNGVMRFTHRFEAAVANLENWGLDDTFGLAFPELRGTYKEAGPRCRPQ
jgi:hypothetical protein